MKIFKFFTLGLTLTIILSSCQKEDIFYSESDLIQQYTALDELFSEYKIVEIDTDGILDYSKKKHDEEFVLDLKISEKPNWVFSLNFHDFFSDEYKAFETDDVGNWIELLRKDRSDAYHGQSKDLESRAMFIMEDHLFTGNILEGDVEYFMEPLNYFVRNTSPNLYVYYPTHADIEGRKTSCGNTDEDFQDIHIEDSRITKANDYCRELSITYVADFQFRETFGNSSSRTRNFVENRIRYGSFRYWGFNRYPLYFRMFRSYVRTTTINPPSTSTTNISVARNQFRSWAPDNIITDDVNLLFTGRDYGSVFGWAEIATVCKSPAYAVISRAGGRVSAGTLNKAVAHEVGHTLSCSHENSGFMKSGNHTSTAMHSSTRHQLDSYLRWNNSCMPSRICTWYK